MPGYKGIIMYILILIFTFIANGAAIYVEHIQFNTKADCQEALITLLRDNPSRKVNSHGALNQLPNGTLIMKGYCVAKG